ncbi:MAG: hypothetical protein CML51_06015 [Rhodobacteraceae bacterium]|nr:hypothetical protein [Paracoccaceae bacterium]
MTESALPVERKPVFSKIVKSYEAALGDGTKDSFNETISVLDSIAKDFEKTGLLAGGIEPALVEHWYTRLVSAITIWATDPQTVLNQDQLIALCRRKQVLLYAASASGFRNMAHLIWLLSSRDLSKELNIAGPKVVLLLALLGLDELTEQLVNIALNQPPPIALHLVLGWLNQRTVLTPTGEANRTLLLNSGGILQQAKITDQEIGQVINAYMYCSYASTPDKHDIKHAFNGLLRARMAEVGVLPAAPARTRREKPRVLVIHERFRTGHAMHRSYAPLIAGLRQRFELTALVEDEQIDKQAEGYFHQVVKIPAKEQKKVVDIANNIERMAPDIILYPSLGMSHWTVMLSNLRLAPIQVMAQGHPATSNSDYIDYAFISPMEGRPEKIHSERLLIGSSPVRFELHAELPDVLPELVKPSSREIRIAVNSKVMKLSHRLLSICKRLEKESPIPLCFRFFPGEFGWFHDGVSAAIKSHLPTASVAPYQRYSDFLTDIAGCDFALAAFPFGNTNSSVDTCLLGLPTVVHFGDETPAQTDAMVLTAAGYPDWLICPDDQTYFETAMRLISNPDERVEISRNARESDLRSALSDNRGGDLSRDLCDLLWHVYENHDAIVASDVRAIRHAQISHK